MNEPRETTDNVVVTNMLDYDGFEGAQVLWADTQDITSWEPRWRSCHWALLPFYLGPLAAWRSYRQLWAMGWRPKL